MTTPGLSIEVTDEERFAIKDANEWLITQATTKDMRKILGLSQNLTSQKYGIKLGTIKKWDRNSSSPVFNEAFQEFLFDCIREITISVVNGYRSKVEKTVMSYPYIK